MTAHSTSNLPARAMHGSRLAQASSAFEVPPHIARHLGGEYPAQLRTLSVAKHEGWLEIIPQLAEKALAALVPVEGKALVNRLTMLGMSMANGKDREQITAWLHETARLLADLPQSVLFDAIDECVKEPGRVFVPSVGEIREKASDTLQKREREAARLNRLANLIAEGVEIPEYIPPEPIDWALPTAERREPNVTPEEAAAILEEFGLKSSMGSKLAGMLKPAQPKSRNEMIAEGREPPPINPDENEGIYV